MKGRVVYSKVPYLLDSILQLTYLLGKTQSVQWW